MRLVYTRTGRDNNNTFSFLNYDKPQIIMQL